VRGDLFCIIRQLDWFSMMREFVSVCSSVERIDRVICGNEGAYILEWNWVFYPVLGFCYYLDF
jgi:hypothetical protein